jgi:imidazolonepropionase-like amidohydrolase
VDPRGVRSDWTRDVHAEGKHARRLITRYLHQSGVPLLLETDAGAYLVEPGHSVHDELEAMTEAGLSAAQALQTATTHPTKYLGLDDEWGSIDGVPAVTPCSWS